MDLTLIIPAKEEKFSLPLVLEEIKDFPAKMRAIPAHFVQHQPPDAAAPHQKSQLTKYHLIQVK